MDNKNKIIKIILTVLGVIMSLKILKFIFSMAFALLIPILIGGGLVIIPILFLLVPIAILCSIIYSIYKFFVKERSVW